jgi:hypothetical protein
MIRYLILLLLVGCASTPTTKASRTHRDIATSQPYLLLADLDGDGDVDITDYAMFAACFNGTNNPPNCDGPQLRDLISRQIADEQYDSIRQRILATPFIVDSSLWCDQPNGQAGYGISFVIDCGPIGRYRWSGYADETGHAVLHAKRE